MFLALPQLRRPAAVPKPLVATQKLACQKPLLPERSLQLLSRSCFGEACSLRRIAWHKARCDWEVATTKLGLGRSYQGHFEGEAEADISEEKLVAKYIAYRVIYL